MAPSDGSGNYSRPAGTTPSTGDIVEAAPFNEGMDDIAAALTARLMANGAKAATANIPMGGFKLTGLAAGSQNGDSVRYEQYTTAASDTTPGLTEYADNTELDAETSTTRSTTVAGVLRMIRNQLASAANIWAGTTNKFVGSENLKAAGAFTTITDGATLATDMALGRNFTTTINDSRTMGAPTNVAVGHVLTYEIVQGTGGSRTITWNSNFKFGDGTATLSTSEGDKDIVSFLCVSSTRIVFLGIRKAVQ